MKASDVVRKLKERPEITSLRLSDEVLRQVVCSTLDEAQRWIPEAEMPAPCGEHLFVSMNGINFSGVLCNKKSNGTWMDVFGKPLKDQSFVKFYRHLVIDTEL